MAAMGCGTWPAEDSHLRSKINQSIEGRGDVVTASIKEKGSKDRHALKPLVCLVAGTGFEPVTFGL
jgi:hypothetical protein